MTDGEFEAALRFLRHYSRVDMRDARVQAVRDALVEHKISVASVTNISGEPGGDVTVLGEFYEIVVFRLGDTWRSNIEWEHGG